MAKRGSAILGKVQKIPSPAGAVNFVTFIPWTLVKRGVKRQIITPLGAPEQFREELVEEKVGEVSALVKALGLAYHWQKLMESGKVRSATQLAELEGISKQRVSLILKLAQLAPNIVESILNGDQRLSLDYFKKNAIPLCWEAQKAMVMA